MKKITLNKSIVSIIFILVLISSGGYMCCKYILLPHALAQAFNPKVSKADIKYAKEVLFEIESLTIYSTSTYERKEVNGQSVSTIRDIEEVKNSNISYFVVDHNIIKEKFQKAKYKPKFIVWKGDRLGIAKLTNGDEKIIRISDYGEFFSIKGIAGFYEFDDK